MSFCTIFYILRIAVIGLGTAGSERQHTDKADKFYFRLLDGHAACT